MNTINYEIIEQYLNGELDGEALQAFEQQLKTDTALATEVALYRNIQQELKQSQQYQDEENALTGTLTALGKQHFLPSPVKRLGMRKLWWVAAAAAAVLLFFIINPLSKSHVTNDQLFAQYAVPENLPAAQRGNAVDSLSIKAARLYNSKAYTEALPLLDSIVKQQPGQPQLQLAIGICQLYTGDYTSSIKNFDELSAGEHIYKNEAIYWKALAYLKQNKKEECIATLKLIPDHEAAKKLLKQL
jgi:predicted Zn-dependent protease